MDENINLETKEPSVAEPVSEILDQTAQSNDSGDFEIKEKPYSYYTSGLAYKFMLCFGIVFMSIIFVFQIMLSPILVIGTSMQPNVNASVVSETDEDHCDIVYYKQDKNYQNNDMVIISNKNQNYVDDKDVRYLIKRVIACPGQTLKVYVTSKDGTKYYYDIMVTNGKDNIDINASDPYIKEDMVFTYTEVISLGSMFEMYKTIFSSLVATGTFEMQIPNSSYFVMGDNRNNSEDSRYFGVVAYEDISGSVKIHVPYGKNVWEALFDKLKSIL